QSDESPHAFFVYWSCSTERRLCHYRRLRRRLVRQGLERRPLRFVCAGRSVCEALPGGRCRCLQPRLARRQLRAAEPRRYVTAVANLGRCVTRALRTLISVYSWSAIRECRSA